VKIVFSFRTWNQIYLHSAKSAWIPFHLRRDVFSVKVNESEMTVFTVRLNPGSLIEYSPSIWSVWLWRCQAAINGLMVSDARSLLLVPRSTIHWLADWLAVMATTLCYGPVAPARPPCLSVYILSWLSWSQGPRQGWKWMMHSVCLHSCSVTLPRCDFSSADPLPPRDV